MYIEKSEARERFILENGRSRMMLPLAEIVPPKEQQLQEVRYRGYRERIYGREGRNHGE